MKNNQNDMSGYTWFRILVFILWFMILWKSENFDSTWSFATPIAAGCWVISFILQMREEGEKAKKEREEAEERIQDFHDLMHGKKTMEEVFWGKKK